MSNLIDQDPSTEHLPLQALMPETHEALTESAERNGRTIHEEAEHIIKTHLAAFVEESD